MSSLDRRAKSRIRRHKVLVERDMPQVRTDDDIRPCSASLDPHHRALQGSSGICKWSRSALDLPTGKSRCQKGQSLHIKCAVVTPLSAASVKHVPLDGLHMEPLRSRVSRLPLEEPMVELVRTIIRFRPLLNAPQVILQVLRFCVLGAVTRQRKQNYKRL
ncbi:hypothetical protein VTK56DRAFT_1317 [Thermocarpiscus australiensis]